MNKKQYRTHRFAWIIKNGKIPKDLCVLHKCDNSRCVNTKHLFLGTRKENNIDRDNKNRTVWVTGSLNGNAKLKEDDVIKIKNLLTKHSFADIGRKFNVRWQTIQAIAKGKTWKNI